MSNRNIILFLVLLSAAKAHSQDEKADTIIFDTQNKEFIEFSGTWYDNLWDNPVMRGTSLSRTKKDSSRFSLTFKLDGTITSQNYRDTFRIMDSTNWWYDGNFIYLKRSPNSNYSQIRIFKYQGGNIVIAFKFTDKFFYLKIPEMLLFRTSKNCCQRSGLALWRDDEYILSFLFATGLQFQPKDY